MGLHQVRFHRNGVKHFTHPSIGQSDLSFQAMELPGDESLTLIVYLAEKELRSHDALALLSTVVATTRERQRF